MGRYTSPQAIAFWNKACNFHRGTDTTHVCGNPQACQRTIDKAESAEEWHLLFVKEWQ